MRMILIDPELKTVTEFDGPDINNLETPAREIIGCSAIDVIYLSDIECLILDDMGLYENPHLYEYKPYPQPLAGKTLVVGINSEGDSVPTQLTVEEVTACVTWRPDIVFTGDTVTTTQDLGFATYIKSTPVFRKK